MFCAESSHLMLEFYRKSPNLLHELYKNPLLSTESSSKEGVCDATLSVAHRVPAEMVEGARAQKEDMRPHFQATLQGCHGLAEERGASTATSRFTALPAISVSRGDL